MSNTMAEPACTVCHKGLIGECECEPQRWPTSTAMIPLGSDWRAAVRVCNIVTQPTIPVTDEMRATMIAHPIARHILDDGLLLSFYRAMAAVAPKSDIASAMIIKSLEGRVGELESYSRELATNLDERNAKDQESEAYQYLKRLFLHMAPQCCVLPHLLGVCTQVDNAIAGLQIDLAARDSRYLDELTTRDKQITELRSKERHLFNLVLQRNQTIADRDREIVQLRAEREAWKYLYEVSVPSSDQRMVAADEAGSHPYHGPTKPVTDANGNVTGRESVPDPVHERAHGVIGDIMAGRVIRPARDQMEKALSDAKGRDEKAPPPFPTAPNTSDPRRVGL